MVGVAGRSKACHTCKERKIRCNGEKPECLNCRKSGRSCAGYRKKQAFILSRYTQTAIAESAQGTLQPAYESGAAPLLLSRWRRDQPTRVPSSTPKPHSYISTSVSLRNVSRDQFLALYLDDEQPSTAFSQAHIGNHRKWLFHLAGISSLSPALEHAILALCTAKLGSKCGHKTLARQSLPLYTRGLRELQRAIDNPMSRYDSQTVTACVMLGMYEFSECPGQTISGYMKHYNGAMAILRMRGPEQHIGGLAHDIFQVMRMHAIFHGLRQRQVTLLGQPEWMEKPWASKPKDPHDLLLDIFLQVPGILARMDALLSVTSPETAFTGTLQLFHFSLGLDEELNDWFSTYQTTIGCLYWPELSTFSSETDNPEQGKTFPVSFHFPSYVVAETMVLYWTIQVLIHANICAIHLRLSSLQNAITAQKNENIGLLSPESAEGTQESTRGDSSPFSDTSVYPLGHQAEWPQTSARYICQSAEYFFDKKFQTIGPGTILSPLVVVRACLFYLSKECARELAWIDEMIRRIPCMGANLAEYIS